MFDIKENYIKLYSRVTTYSVSKIKENRKIKHHTDMLVKVNS